jgi:hypothetical protein
MKKNIRLYNSDNPPTSQKKEISAQAEQSKTPYLKAILSGASRLFSMENKKTDDTNPDRNAALRYIKESALLRNLYAGDMSC